MSSSTSRNNTWWQQFTANGVIGKAKALCDYDAPDRGYLSFQKDNEIAVILSFGVTDNLFYGALRGKIGLVEVSKVRFLPDLTSLKVESRPPTLANRTYHRSLSGSSYDGDISAAASTPASEFYSDFVSCYRLSSVQISQQLTHSPGAFHAPLEADVDQTSNMPGSGFRGPPGHREGVPRGSGFAREPLVEDDDNISPDRMSTKEWSRGIVSAGERGGGADPLGTETASESASSSIGWASAHRADYLPVRPPHWDCLPRSPSWTNRFRLLAPTAPNDAMNNAMGDFAGRSLVVNPLAYVFDQGATLQRQRVMGGDYASRLSSSTRYSNADSRSWDSN